MARTRSLAPVGKMVLWILIVAAASAPGCKKKRHSDPVPFPEYGPPRPTIHSIVPDSGFLGDTVTLAGANFDPVPADNTITFNGGTVTAVAGDSSVLVTSVPVGASTGPLTVTVAGRVSNALNFTVLGGPQILQISPDIGPTGTQVTLTGLNFSPIPPENTILFEFDGIGGVEAPAASATGGQLVCFAPAGATTGLVVVQVGGLDSNVVNYTYVTPRLIDVGPRSGNFGGFVTLFGENFAPLAQDNVIRFNGTVATTNTATPGILTTQVPNGSTAGPVTVEAYGFESNGIFFCVWNPAPSPPNISGTTPGQGAWDDPVTIQGSGFAANVTDNEVRFNGILAQVLGATGTTIDTTVPPGAITGPITVSRGPETATSGADFTVTDVPPPPPVLDALRPSAAPELSSILIEGSGFNTAPGSNRITFAGEPAEVLAASATALLVKVPFTRSGVVTVDVGGQVSNGLNFSVQGSGAGLNTFPLFGRQIASPSDSVIYIVDLSGSMVPPVSGFMSYEDRFGNWTSGSRLQVVQDRIIFSISELPPGFTFNVIAFSAGLLTCPNNMPWQQGSPVLATQLNKDAAIAWVQAWSAGGGTATTYAVEAALQMDPNNQTICLITDGQWNCPNGETNADQLCRMFNANLQNAAIHTFGIDVGGGFAVLLRDIASITGGTYRRIVSPVSWP